jgi:hypothetical protein
MREPLFREQMVIAVHRQHRLANESCFPVKELRKKWFGKRAITASLTQDIATPTSGPWAYATSLSHRRHLGHDPWELQLSRVRLRK